MYLTNVYVNFRLQLYINLTNSVERHGTRQPMSVHIEGETQANTWLKERFVRGICPNGK